MDLAYSIKRSAKRRRVTITVERDRTVVVHAPSRATDRQIEALVQSKRQWIYEKTNHAQKYEELPHPPGKEIVSGESALYLGRNYRIELVDEGHEVRFAQRILIPRQHAGTARDLLKAWYRHRADVIILPRVARIARDLGVSYGIAKVVKSHYRWGSCTPKGNVTFNWRLIKAPMFVVDYLIVHELTHLIESNHTSRFWNIVRTHAPRADRAKDWLKEHGQLLEEEV